MRTEAWMLVLLALAASLTGCIGQLEELTSSPEPSNASTGPSGTPKDAGNETDAGRDRTTDQGGDGTRTNTTVANGTGDDPRAPRGPDLGPGVVVADVSWGVNPYHEAFRRPDWTVHPSQRVPGIPEDLPALNLTLGDDYDENVQADEDVWADYEVGQPYWVPGTNLILMTDEETSRDPLGRESPTGAHGTATGGAIEKACHGCYILVMQDGNSIDGDSVRRIARNLSWVDLVTSTAIPGNPVENYPASQYANATYELRQTGRLFVGPSGNRGTPALAETLWRGWSLPPWAVLVGGAHSSCSASEANGGKPPEFVGNFTQDLPRPDRTSGTYHLRGTSFSTPQVAGFLGRTLLEVRQHLGYGDPASTAYWTGIPQDSPPLQDGRLNATELRSTMATAADYFEATSYEADCSPVVGGTDKYGTPVAPAPWLQMGWGYVGENASTRAAQALLGATELEPKSEQARAYMDQHYAARSALYDDGDGQPG